MKNEILPAVAAIVFNDQGEILLQKRKDRNKWGLLSGHVEFGESVEQAILREVKEEANVDADIVRLIGVYSTPAYQTYTYTDRIVQYITAYFELRLKTEIEESYFNDETLQLKFFAVDDIPDEMDLINPHWLDDAQQQQPVSFVR